MAPAIRISYIVASEKVIEQLGDIRMQIDYGLSILSQIVIYKMLKNDDYDKHTQNIIVHLKAKRDYMLAILE
ncbi:TPA: hypothetical protein ACOHM4_002917 [Staphylococcus aureus]